MREIIDARTSGPNVDDNHDLLSRLISARETEKDSPHPFTDDKLTGGSIFSSWFVCLHPLPRQWCELYYFYGHILSTS